MEPPDARSAERQAVPARVASRIEPVGDPPEAGETGTSVRARFLDERGAPIAGVELCVPGDADVVASSRGDGIAEALLPAALLGGSSRPLTFVASCPGFATELRRATVEPRRTLLLGDWLLVRGGDVEGTVVDEEGLGLPGVQLACLGEDVDERGGEGSRRAPLESLWRPGARALSSADGSFVLESAPAGRIRVLAVADGRPAGFSGLVEVPPGGIARGVTIRMAPADGGTTIAGIVLDPGGTAIPGASVRIEGGRSSYGIRAAQDGRFRLRLPDREPCDVSASDPAGRHRGATRLGVVPGTTDLVLQLSPADEVELEVRSHAGIAVERFAVALITAREATPLGFFREEERPEGLFLFGVPAQDFLVEVRANGWRPARLGPFPSGAPPRLIECRLAPASGIRGRITADERPSVGAYVALHEAVGENDTYNGFPLRMHTRPAVETESDPQGEFALSVEHVGHYYLRVEAEGYALAERGPLALSPDGEREEDIALDQGGTLVVRVRSAEGASVAGVLVALSRGDGLARTRRTDETGTLELPRLTPGPWQVELSDEEIDPEHGATYFGTQPAGEVPSNCRVLAGEVTRVDLWLEESGPDECRLAGRLTIDGRPAEGWRAGLDREGEPVVEGQRFLEPGSFRLGVDEPGSYRLRLSTDSTEASAMLVLLDPVELHVGERHWSLELRTGAIEGTLGGASAGALVFHRWRRGALECYAPLVPDADGRFRCARVPAGPGAIVSCDPDVPLEEQTPLVLRELVVEAGKTTSVEL
jgi:hypothetical protein